MKAPKTIFLSEHYTGYEERHLGEVLRTFEKHGFSFTSNREEATYYLDYTIEGGAIVTVDISLLREGKSLVEASSTNYGWGTAIARPIAIAG